MGIKPPLSTCQCVEEIISVFRDCYSKYFDNGQQVYKILSPDTEVQTDTKAESTEVELPPCNKQELLMEQCYQYGVAVDVDDMILYALVVNNPQALNYLKSLCNTDQDGYAVKLVVLQQDKKVLMDTKFYIRGSDAKTLQIMYSNLRKRKG